LIGEKFIENVVEEIKKDNSDFIICDNIIINKYQLYVKYGLHIPNENIIQRWLA
jgi:hypothetical protein